MTEWRKVSTLTTDDVVVTPSGRRRRVTNVSGPDFANVMTVTLRESDGSHTVNRWTVESSARVMR